MSLSVWIYFLEWGVGSRFYNHVVHVDLEDVTQKLLVIDFIDHSLTSGPRVSQTEGHYVVVIFPRLGHEGCFLFIFFGHGYLVVTRIGVHEG